MTDPFAHGVHAFRARPGARVRIDRTAPPDLDDERDERAAPPRAADCPTFQTDAFRGECFWHLDAFGTPRQLLDGGTGGVVWDRAHRGDVETTIRAVSYTWRDR